MKIYVRQEGGIYGKGDKDNMRGNAFGVVRLRGIQGGISYNLGEEGLL